MGATCTRSVRVFYCKVVVKSVVTSRSTQRWPSVIACDGTGCTTCGSLSECQSDPLMTHPDPLPDCPQGKALFPQIANLGHVDVDRASPEPDPAPLGRSAPSVASFLNGGTFEFADRGDDYENRLAHAGPCVNVLVQAD